MANESNPWAWQQWAATQDPSLYGWKNMGGLQWDDLAKLQPALQAAGLWQDAWGGDNPQQWNAETGQYFTANAPDLSSLAGYGVGNARSIDGATLTGYVGPDGKPILNSDGSVLNGNVTNAHSSLTGGDYGLLASVPLAGAGVALGGASGLGQSLYGLSGMAGSAAGGATLGAVSGGLNAAFNDQNVLQGALRGGALGGIGGAASSYFGGTSGIDPAATQYDYTNQMDLASDANRINLPAGWADVQLPEGYDQAVNWQPQDLGGQAGQSILDASTGAPLDQFTINGSQGIGQLGSLPELSQSAALDSTSMQVPDYGQQISDQFNLLPQANMLSSGLASGLTMPSVPQLAAPLAGSTLADMLKNATGLTGNQLLGGAAAIGAVAGAQGTPAQTQTTQSKTDPRFDPYLYGSGGLLQAAQDTYNANKTPNAAMQAGWNQQLGLLNDPTVANQLQQFRTQGAGLLGGSIAQNPFSTGKAKLIGG